MNDRYWVENEDGRGYPEESLHFWKDGKLVYEIPLLITSDDEKGVMFCTERRFIERARDNAEFYVEKDGRFYLVYEIEWLFSIRRKNS